MKVHPGFASHAPEADLIKVFNVCQRTELGDRNGALSRFVLIHYFAENR